MQIIYNGADITGFAPVASAFAWDFDGSSADALEVTFYDSKRWNQDWQPVFDDTIELKENEYTTGLMYVDMIEPDENGYTIRARSTPRSARARKYAGYSLVTLKQLAEKAAADLGMATRYWGTSANPLYQRVLRENEGWLAMLSRTASLEGNAVKCGSGRIHLIGMDWAQNQPATETLDISDKTPGVVLARKDIRASSCIVHAARGRGKAMDAGGNTETIMRYGLPATDSSQAARWARWQLFFNNRGAEQLSIEGALAPWRAAFQRIDLTGSYPGEWIVHSVRHDLKDKTSKTVLLKCLKGIVEVPI